MSKEEREDIIAQRVANRLLGKPILMVGDIVQGTYSYAMMRRPFRANIKYIGVIRYITTRSGPSEIPCYGVVELMNYNDELHNCDGYTKEGHGWWCDADDLELVKGVEQEDDR